MHRNILVLPGGCTRGAIQISCLAEIEAITGKPISELFQLIVASSVGTINGTALASGVPAETIKQEMRNSIPYMFTARSLLNPFNWLRPRYERKRVLDVLGKYVPSSGKYSDLKTPVVCAAWDMSNKKPIFFKSDAAIGQQVSAIEVVSWCFAAPIFFGTLSPEVVQATVSDADVGDKNNPVDQAFQEALIRGWVGETTEDTISVTIVSTGSNTEAIPFSMSSKWGYLKQVFHAIRQGSSDGVSRYDTYGMKRIAEAFPSKISFQYIDVGLTSSQYKFGNVADIETFISLGKGIARLVDVSLFKV